MQPMAKAAPVVPASLAVVLADTYALVVLAQGAHWNVSGADFAEYHALFGAIYDEVYAAIDPLAENILKSGGTAPGSLSALQQARTGTDPDSPRNPLGLAEMLADANDRLLAQIAGAFAVASAANEQGIANFLAERDDAHKKWRWQLRSSLGQPVG